jgi:predicted transcriptional regulator
VNRMVRRSAFELCCEILDALAEGPLKKTRVMYKANLCIRSLESSLQRLNENGLIAEKITKMKSGNKNRYTYFITPKGIEALNHYRLCKDMLRSGEREALS